MVGVKPKRMSAASNCMRNALGRLGINNAVLATSRKSTLAAAALPCLDCTSTRASWHSNSTSMPSACAGMALYNKATSITPSTSCVCMPLDKPSVIRNWACGSSVLKARNSGMATLRATLGGMPKTTRPDKMPRAPVTACLARSTWYKIPCTCSSSNSPASVSAAPRPLRVNSVWRNSTSKARTWRDKAGCATPRACEAFVKLPSSATRSKYASCLKSIPLTYVHVCHAQLVLTARIFSNANKA